MSDCFIYSNDVRQVIIQGCNLYQSVIGEVWVTASSLSMESVFMFDYKEASKYNLADGDVIWVDSSNKIVYSYPHEGSKSNYYTNTCPRCGGPLESTFRGMQCKDENCVSRIYPRICHMLDTLKIPPLSVERFKELVADDKILYVLDVFSLPEYKDVKVSCNIASVLFSLVPQRMANDFLRSDIQYFVNKCNNNLTTVIYYIEHLTSFKNNSVYPDSSSFFVFLEWLNEPENLLMFKNLLSVKQVSIDETVRRFEGAPIFRNRKFLLTGTFSHGTLDDVKSILRSYSAAILDDFSDEISAVIVGDILEDVRGEWIQEARYRGIPVITESKLFRDHKIDEDLSALNLL